jgi:hypothetical protein
MRTSPYSTTQLREGGNAMAEQAHQQASNYCGPATPVDVARVRARGGEDPNGGLRLHPSSSQGRCSLHQL